MFIVGRGDERGDIRQLISENNQRWRSRRDDDSRYDRGRNDGFRSEGGSSRWNSAWQDHHQNRGDSDETSLGKKENPMLTPAVSFN